MDSAIVFLSLGTNIGAKEENLQNAMKELNERAGKILSESAFYYSKPWGFSSDNDFVNICVALETTKQPEELLDTLQEIERDMGRKQKSINQVYTDRIIDIDIILWGEKIIQTDRLTIPHPYMQDRDFVIIPLAEIAPNVVHPVMLKKIVELTKHLER